MSYVLTDSFGLTAAMLVAIVLMILSGVRKKQLHWRGAVCPVCHHPRGSCTCRWL